MKSETIRTKIFLDSGDPAETKEAIRLLGFLDGQTTNPSLVAKNPDASGKNFTKPELLGLYKKIVQEISKLIPEGSVSIEVYADFNTIAQEMLQQGREMFSWIPNAHIKYPTTTAGLETVQQSVADGMRVNMTLVFSQQQAAAVYAATRGANKGDVFVSPFVGRLDDRGENGMQLIGNILNMYEGGDKHVEVLVASVRNLDHLFAALHMKADIVTAPIHVLREWARSGKQIPGKDFQYVPADLQPIAYETLDLDKRWTAFDISHELTDKGVERFTNDWNSLLKPLKP
jgi:transaldolase